MTLNLLSFPTKNRLMTRKLDRVTCVIVHGTGDTDLDKVLHYYTEPNKACPHFLVETTGLVRQLCDYDRVAAHAALYEDERGAYERGLDYWTRCVWLDDARAAKLLLSEEGTPMPPRKCFDRWRRRWPGKDSPLLLKSRSAPNQNSIGVELLSPLDAQRTPRIYVDAQYEQLALLLATIGHRLGLKIDQDTVLEHSDVNPLRRTTDRGGAYDPGEKFDWGRLWNLYREVV